MLRRGCSLLLMLLLAAGPVAAAQLAADLVARHLEQRPEALRWVPVTPLRGHVSGVLPVYNTVIEQYRVTPGSIEGITIRLPAGARLLVRRLDGGRAAPRLQVSGDAMLFRPETLLPAGEKGAVEWVLAETALDARLVRITSTAGDDQATFALYTSEPADRGESLLQPTGLLAANAATVRLADGDGLPGMRWFVAEPGADLAVDVDGVRQLHLHVRLPLDRRLEADWMADLWADDVFLRTATYSSPPEEYSAVRVDGVARPVTREEVLPVELPAGAQRIRIRFNRPAWVQLRAGREDDFLWLENDPWREEPVPTDAHTAGASRQAASPDPAGWTPAERAGRLRALARDNGRRDAGLQAEAIARKWAAWPGTTTQDRRLLLHAVRNVSHWEALRPAASASGYDANGRDVYLARFEVRDELDNERERVDWTGGAHSLQRPLVALRVHTLPWSQPEALVYRLPERAVESRLLVATDLAGSALLVQFDDAEPIAVMSLPHPAEAGTVDAGYLSAAAAGDAHQANPSAPRWIAAGKGQPRDLWMAAHAELALPATVRTVRVWRDAFSARRTEVGIAFREGHDDRLEETGYRSRLALAGGPAATRKLFHDSLRLLLACRDAGERYEACATQLRDAVPSTDPAAQSAALQLVNDWLPMLRLLQVRAAQFAGTVRSPFGNGAGASRPAASGPVMPDRPDEPYRVLGEWQRRQAATGADGGPEAWLQRAGALQALGENFLARQVLRALVLFAPPGPLVDEAAGRLQSELEPGEPLATGLAVTLYRGDPRQEAVLLAALLAENEPAFAVKAALALGTQADTWQALGLPYAALAAGWSGGSDPDDAKRAGAVDAGPLVTEAAQLRSLVMDWPHEDAGAQRDRLEAWRQLQAAIPGPRVLRSDHAQVTQSAGAEMITVPERDLTLELLRAAPGRPVRYEDLGAGRIEVSFRRIVPADADRTAAETLWVQVRSGAASWRIPLHEEPVSTTLGRLPDGASVSSAWRLRWRLPAGFHALEIEPEAGEVLLQLRSEQPLWQPDFLPRPTPATVRTVAAGPGLLPPAEAGTVDDPVTLRPLSVRQPAGPGQPELSLETLLPPTAAPSPEVAPVVLRAWSLLDELQRTGAPAQAAELAQLIFGNPAEEELKPLQRQLVAQGWQWRRGGLVLQSAGAWTMEQGGWMPASPALRSRALLLPPAGDDVEMLSGDDTLHLEISGSGAGRLRLHLRQRMLPFLPFVPAGVQVEVPGSPVRLLELADEQARTVTLRVPAGQQSIRILPVDLPPNALLEVRAEQATPSGWAAVTGGSDRAVQMATAAEPVVAFLDGPALYRIDQWEAGRLQSRFHAVGEAGEELALRPEMPAARAGFTIRRLAREDSAVLAEQAATQYAMRSAIAQVAQAREALQEPPAPAVDPVPVPELPGSVRLTGPDPRPGLRVGSHAFYVNHRVRLQLDDEGTGGGGETRVPEQEYGIQHFLRDEERGLYWSSAAFVREPEDGDRVYGLRTGYDRYEPFSPWSHGVDASLHAQDPTGDDEWATALLLRGRIDYTQLWSPRSRMRWRLGGFVRHLGLDPGETGGLETDPDVYSDFKQDHLHGASAQWQWTYTPWLDTRWEAALASHTNENLDPFHADRLELVLGWSQVVDGWVAGAEYQLRQFNADADRSAFARRERIRFSFERDFWSDHGGRYSFTLNLDRDLFRDLWIGGLRFTWFPEGDDYHHQAPGTVAFEPFRARRIPDGKDHAIAAP